MVLHVLLLDKIPSTGSGKLGGDFRPMAGKYLVYVSLVIVVMTLLHWVNFLQLFWRLPDAL